MTGIDYRKNLITVPSCDVHNLKTSKDDEYLLTVVLAHHMNNRVGYTHFMSKMIRSFRRNASLAKRLLEASSPIKVNGQIAGILFPEPERVDSQIRKIALGIHYHHFQQKWLDNIIIESPSCLAINDYPKISQMRFLDSVFHILKNESKYGANQDVFYYQIFYSNNPPRVTIMKLVFYQGLEIMACSGRAVDAGLKNVNPRFEEVFRSSQT